MVVDHNIQRRASALNAAMRRTARSGARLVTLQEVCWWHVRNLREQHPGWSIAYQPDAHSGRCRTRPDLGSLPDADRDDSGNVVIWTGGDRAGVGARVFRAQPSRGFRQGMACLHVRVRIALDVCSVHLAHAGVRKQLRRVQVRQAREVDRATRRWIARGHLVVVGGDFNAAPSTRPLDQLYRVNGTGRFVEATGCRPTVDLCRRTRGVTLDRGRQKIDYVFFSANRTPPGTLHGLSLTHTLSDHHLLTGWAYVDVRPARRGPGRTA
ncbi:endonuclease/exonuclease/phosphatase family protein [Nocardioides sp.]|uniref:endonuclease/exonuclease/phosphatase family protein n=1 Tax=Nocardioides sp. TaxID=35761 RepID=UPI002724D680|nr:endonuclease/exonuclease/phosphatase family protein [Nocardioides sp.]MDO9457460.1 endonuclease/exonuclease/phosphatase family protein [Nocardioides sp.]